MTSYIAKLDGAYNELATVELSILANAGINPFYERFVQFETNTAVNWKRLGLSHDVYEIIGTATNEEDAISLCSNDQLTPTYKINIHECGGTAPEVKQLADKIYHTQQGATVDIHNPKNTIVFFFTKESIYVTKKVFTQVRGQQEGFDSRKAHVLPGQHPTTMDPKLARAMINLANTKSFHDPFCGSGGIVSEGALMGLHATGSDIVPAMISRAQANAAHLKTSATFSVEDALTSNKVAEAIITDLPYGRNATLSDDKDTLYKDFFVHAQKLTTTMVVGTNVDPKVLLAGTKWKVEKQFSIYVHKSLTRIISLLKLHN